LIVTPALRTADGAETALAAVTVKPNEVQSIDLDAAIAAARAPQLAGTYGSVVLRFRSASSANLYAAMMIRRTEHPVAFHIDAIGESLEVQADAREGVWWLPNGTASDYLILTNQGENTIQLDLSVFDSAGKAFTQKLSLGPRQTNRLSVRRLVQLGGLTGTFGGIRISAAGHAGSLDSLHFLFDTQVGFSALLKMFDHNPNSKLEERDFAKTGAWTLRAPMLALSNPDPALAFPPGTTLHPQIFVRNTTAKVVDASVRFGSKAATSLRLNPNETRGIDVSAFEGTAIPKQSNWTSVAIGTKGSPDEIVAVAASYDRTLRYGAQTPFSDQLSFQWEGGMWEYDPYHSSIITAGNGGTKPTQVAFTIFYNQGAEKYELEQTLQPDEQMWVNIGQLIREHVPDKNAKTLPVDLTMGSYEIRDLTNSHVGSLFEGKIIYDKTYGHAAYGCARCCGYPYAPGLNFNPLGIPFQSTSPNGATALNSCTNYFDDVSDSFYGNWTTVDTSIATVDYYATHTGVAVGSTTSNTFGSIPTVLRYTCPLTQRSGHGADKVTPVITSVSPSRGLIGATTSSVTIIGTGLSGGHINTPAAIQVQNITTATNVKIVFDAVISSTATTGNNAAAIYVTAAGEDSNKVDFYVQVPTSLSMVAGSASGTTEKMCNSNTCGTIVSFKYQTYDQDKPAQPIRAQMSMWDSFASQYSPDNLHLQGSPYTTTCPNNSGPCGVLTVSDGTFTEFALGACYTVCYVNGACTTGGPSGINQTWHIASSPIVQSLSEYCEKILVNNVQIQ
jgi:hypothetical protein